MDAGKVFVLIMSVLVIGILVYLGLKRPPQPQDA